MKGHSIPGMKGFKSTSKKDGRAASSAFQMKSPLYEEAKKSTLGAESWKSPELGEEKDKYNRTQQKGESGVDFGVRGLVEMAQRLKDKKAEKAKSASDKLGEQTDKYDEVPKGTTTGTNSEGDEVSIMPGYDADGNPIVDEKKLDVKEAAQYEKIKEDEKVEGEDTEKTKPYTKADLKNLPQGSEERKQAYKDLGWGWDETLGGTAGDYDDDPEVYYNHKGEQISAEEFKKTNEANKIFLKTRKAINK